MKEIELYGLDLYVLYVAS